MGRDRTDIRAIKERADIVSVISRYVSLTKSGSSHKGRCPFHKDDTPSLVVSAEKGLWHCFGCGEGGDILGFLMKIERLSFVEAAKRLAAEVGLSFSAGESGEQEKMRSVLGAVARYFADNLRGAAEGQRAREYLHSRGYSDASWDRFGLGYALPGWDNVKKGFASRFGEAQLVELGLLVRGDNGVYDRFRDRTIFPILDLSDRPIAFGGRAFEGQPKYLNSPKTPLFDKGRLLYGLSWARGALAEGRTAILVEGYTDVLTLHEAGVTNVVGSMGTALTQGQADLLARFVDEVVIAYDRDAAGGAAALRGMQILRNSGLAVRVARLAPGQDPDGLVRQEGGDAIRSVVQEAVPFHRFYIDSVIADHDPATIVVKEQILAEAGAFYRGIRSLPLRQEVARDLADVLDLPVEEVTRELSGRRPSRRLEPEVTRRGERWSEEETLLALLLRRDVSWDDVGAVAAPEDFSSANRPIAEALASAAESANIAELVEDLDEESARRASYYALASVVFSDPKKAAQDALSKLVRIPAIERKLADLDAELSTCEDNEDWERWNELTRQRVALVAEKLGRKGSDGKRKADDRSEGTTH
jgi:DNA primase